MDTPHPLSIRTGVKGVYMAKRAASSGSKKRTAGKSAGARDPKPSKRSLTRISLSKKDLDQLVKSYKKTGSAALGVFKVVC